MNMNGNMFASITSMSQILNAASKVDLVEMSSQLPPVLPRIPGAGKDHIVYVAPNFDDTMEFNV